MVSLAANTVTVSGTVLFAFSVLIRYLIPLYPAEGIDPLKVKFHLEILQYSGLALAVSGASFAAWRSNSNARRFRISVLVLAVFVLCVISMYRGDPEAMPVLHAAPSAPSKYQFSEDWVSYNTTHWTEILRPFKNRPGVRALEVGSFEGRSALWFLENVLTDPTSSITCIDIWVGPYEKTFDRNIRAYGNSRKVIKIKDRSDKALRGLRTRSFDFIYIDGSHEAKDVLVDAVLAWDLLKPGGIMIFDDYNWYGPRSWLVTNYTPKIAVNAFVKIFEPYIHILHKDYQLVVRKKTEQETIDLDSYKSLRPIVIGIQRLLG